MSSPNCSPVPSSENGWIFQNPLNETKCVAVNDGNFRWCYMWKWFGNKCTLLLPKNLCSPRGKVTFWNSLRIALLMVNMRLPQQSFLVATISVEWLHSFFSFPHRNPFWLHLYFSIENCFELHVVPSRSNVHCWPDESHLRPPTIDVIKCAKLVSCFVFMFRSFENYYYYYIFCFQNLVLVNDACELDVRWALALNWLNWDGSFCGVAREQCKLF